MQNSFKADYENIIDILQGAKSGIEAVTNPEIQNLVTRLKLDITKHINFLKVRIGVSPDAEKKPEVKPLRKILGRVVMTDTGAPASPKPIISTPRDLEKQELKAKAEEIYGTFAITESDQLYDTLSDTEVRAVAKKAGLPVSDKSPKRIDIAFINQIKDAIIKQHNSGRLVVDALKDKSVEEVAPVNEGAEVNEGSDELGEWLDPGADLKDDSLNEETAANEKTAETVQPEEENGNLKMLNELTELTNAAILEAYEEDQIKSFALMANLDVTDKTKIDSKFITQLKEAIKTLNAGTNQ